MHTHRPTDKNVFTAKEKYLGYYYRREIGRGRGIQVSFDGLWNVPSSEACGGLARSLPQHNLQKRPRASSLLGLVLDLTGWESRGHRILIPFVTVADSRKEAEKIDANTATHGCQAPPRLFN